MRTLSLVESQEVTEIFLCVLRQNPERTLENLNRHLARDKFRLQILREIPATTPQEAELPYWQEDL